MNWINILALTIECLALTYCLGQAFKMFATIQLSAGKGRKKIPLNETLWPAVCWAIFYIIFIKAL